MAISSSSCEKSGLIMESHKLGANFDSIPDITPVQFVMLVILSVHAVLIDYRTCTYFEIPKQ